MTKVMPWSSQVSCSPPSRPLRAAFGGGLRPALTAAARAASSSAASHREKHHQVHGRALLHNLTDTTSRSASDQTEIFRNRVCSRETRYFRRSLRHRKCTKETSMIRIDRVVTKGGDGGETSLGDGSRVSKADPRIEAIGAVDEANATVGVLRLHTGCRPTQDAMLVAIQNDLFDVGADLCVPGHAGDRLRLTNGQVARLEAEVEAMNAALPALTSFILPGGTQAAAFAHLARVTVRRAERMVVSVDDVNPTIRRYLNRLSDHLFVLARVFNENAAAELLWVPGANH